MVIELEKEMDGTSTGRIRAIHTDGSGKRTAVDIWEIKGDGLVWICRNLPKQPAIDADIIKDLQNENQVLKNKLAEIKKNFPGRRPKYDRNDIDKMKKMVAEGMPVEKIATEFGCSRQYVYRLLKKRGGFR